MTRVLTYARYSSDTQSPASIEDQRRICRARAEREGWTIVAEHADAAISGATLLRPGYQAMLRDLQAGKAELVLAESLDRISRDQEHVAAFYKLCTFLGVQIVTLADGAVGQLHVGVRGTLGAAYLSDLADKTRRGEAGRILKGRSIGPAPFGYRVLRQSAADGEPDRGLREIDPTAAEVVHRIFRDYVSGLSPLAIARNLNAEGIPGPSGGPWYHPSIRGRPTRQDGILRNRLYIGDLVWNRRRTVTHPVSGQKLRRTNAPSDIVEAKVPQLRIIDDMLWHAAQARLQAEALSPAAGPAPGENGFWNRRRPHNLLSGKAFCGRCDGPVGLVGGSYLGCIAARNGGCGNTKTLRRPPLEALVLGALATELIQPDTLAAFIDGFNEVWHRHARQGRAASETARRELQKVEQKIEHLLDIITSGQGGPSIHRRLTELEALQAKLQTEMAKAPTAPPPLHPGLATTYRRRLAELQAALADRDNPEALEQARSLIDRVIISPGTTPEDPPQIELIGALINLLKTAGAPIPSSGTATETTADRHLFDLSVKEAAGGKAPRLACFPTTPVTAPTGSRRWRCRRGTGG